MADLQGIANISIINGVADSQGIANTPIINGMVQGSANSPIIKGSFPMNGAKQQSEVLGYEGLFPAATVTNLLAIKSPLQDFPPMTCQLGPTETQAMARKNGNWKKRARAVGRKPGDASGGWEGYELSKRKVDIEEAGSFQKKQKTLGETSVGGIEFNDVTAEAVLQLHRKPWKHFVGMSGV